MEIDLDLFGKLTATLDSISGGIAKLNASLDQRKSDIARDSISRNSGVCPTPTASFSFAIERPQMGRIQQCRAIRVGPPVATTASPTASAVYIIQNPTDPLTTSIDLGSLIDVRLSPVFPIVAFYSAGQIVLRNTDRLWIVVTGAVAAQQFVANAQFEDYMDGGYASVREL